MHVSEKMQRKGLVFKRAKSLENCLSEITTFLSSLRNATRAEKKNKKKEVEQKEGASMTIMIVVMTSLVLPI